MTDRVDVPTAGLAATTLLALLVASAQAPLGSTMIAVGLPAIAEDLGRELPFVTSLLVTSYLIVSIVAQSPAGKLGDVLGHDVTVRLGLLLQALGSVIGLIARSVPLLVVSRVAMALGGAFVIPATMALLRVHVPEERRGRVFGLVGATMGISAAVGPPLGGELVSRFGWRALFVAPLPLVVVAALLVRVGGFPPRVASRSSLRDFAAGFDLVGTALIGAGLTAIVGGAKLHGAASGVTLASGAVTLAAFVAWELRTPRPVLDPRLFGRRAFAAGTGIVGLQNFAMYGLLFQLPQYFGAHGGATPREVGHALFAMMIPLFLASAAGGRATDRFGARRTALLGAGLLCVGVFGMLRLRSFATPGGAVPPLLFVGLGVGLSSAPCQSAAMAAVLPAESGMAAGASSTVRYLGGVATILVLGAVLGARGAAASVDAHLLALRVGAGAALVAFALAWWLPGSELRPIGDR